MNAQTITRRDVLKLAGTAAAFSCSFGFLHGSTESGQLTNLDSKLEASQQLLLKWKQAEFKYFSGGQLLGTSEFPSAALKILQTNIKGEVEIKLFRGGSLLRTLGKIGANT